MRMFADPPRQSRQPRGRRERSPSRSAGCTGADHAQEACWCLSHGADATGIGGSGALRYWITSSAVANSVSGMVMPSALAVLRLITSSNLVGCSTGKSPGGSPFRIRAT